MLIREKLSWGIEMECENEDNLKEIVWERDKKYLQAAPDTGKRVDIR